MRHSAGEHGADEGLPAQNTVPRELSVPAGVAVRTRFGAGVNIVRRLDVISRPTLCIEQEWTVVFTCGARQRLVIARCQIIDRQSLIWESDFRD